MIHHATIKHSQSHALGPVLGAAYAEIGVPSGANPSVQEGWDGWVGGEGG